MPIKGYLIEKYNVMSNAYTCNRLAEEAGKVGIDLQIAGIYDTMVTPEGVFNNNTLLEPRDFVINRYKWGQEKDSINALALRSYNSLNAYNIYINKYEQVKRLHSEAFLMPKYILGTSLLPFEHIVKRLGLPFVAKGLESSMGEEIVCIQNQSSYEELSQKYPCSKEWLFEEFISESFGRDMRFYSIRGEVAACMQRRSQGDFRANVALGATVEPFPITPAIRTIARDIYEQTGLDFLGIDLLFGKEKPYFCEINVMPGLEGIEKASGVNVAGKIIETIQSDFARDAEDFVYQSYLRAAAHQDYAAGDALKRHPELTRNLLREKSHTPCVVVTGSKGKGSVANMISRILQTKYSVGLMTSPHITDFRERFRVNGKMITEEVFCRLMSQIQPEIMAILTDLPDDICVSPMGIQADLALTWFQEKHTDFNVFECGKGAKYDDVNNIRHDYAVINRIFLEHTRELGDSLTAIAQDKAHVITGEQKFVYIAEQEPEVLDILLQRAADLQVPCKVYGRDFHAENIRYTCSGMQFDVVIGDIVYPNLQIPLLGEHQVQNCALALALCVDVFSQLTASHNKIAMANLPVFLQNIRENLLTLRWPGRMEILQNDPFVMLDACINSASCGNVKKVLRHLGIRKCTVIVGIPDDKDYTGVVRSMSEVADRIILTRSQNPHYLFTQKQQETLAREGIVTEWTDSLEQAFTIISTSLQIPCNNDNDAVIHSYDQGYQQQSIVILGTTSVISEVEEFFQSNTL